MKELIIKEKNIVQARKFIRENLISQLNITKDYGIEIVTEYSIKTLVKLYDKYVLDNYIRDLLCNDIKVSVSNRMTSSGGKTIYTKKDKLCTYEIRISANILKKFLEEENKKKICGIEGHDILDALMLILEHELCHVLEFSVYGNSSCKQRRFKALAWKLFRHTTSYHEISTTSTMSMINNEVKIGEKVKFFHKGIDYEGIVTNINKRATIMVEDKNGTYKDSKGINYTKWYVPVNMII